MKVAVFSAKPYDREYLDAANERFGHELTYYEPKLTRETSSLASGRDAVCLFVNDSADAGTIESLASQSIRAIALRCAGFNNVDIRAAHEHGVIVVRVPEYSPHAVAEHTAGLMLCLNRRIHRAYARVREHNFSLEGLTGFDMHGKTVGVIGTGRIGQAVARILLGFGCRVLAHDPAPDEACRSMGVEYVDFDRLLSESDIITLHCPLTPKTHHLINEAALARMKRGAKLINTSRGAVIDTRAVIGALKTGRLGYLGVDVYEEEGDFFFRDLSDRVIQDDTLARLLTFPNVLVTGHQAFFTREALRSIAETTLENLAMIERGESCPNEVRAEDVMGQ